jgi:hypothetical protein
MTHIIRYFRCRERQNQLESRYQSLQKRINLLRAQKIGQHAAEQIQVHFFYVEGLQSKLLFENYEIKEKMGRNHRHEKII